MSFTLGQRRPTPRAVQVTTGSAAPAIPATATGTLAELDCGARARVTGVSGGADPATARRLVDLGFAPGAEVEMVRRAPMADPVVFRVAGYDIALRRMQARCIQVSTTS
ncbi:FeoA family protein [Nocardioides rubriscoriae]|uniref:FeoA family protein n=1 Tax=Nocardioides rubriscoriae TaxID=642762 RepID=UPI0011DF6EA7|nr:FeoA family protein [Nocardioides rubriscoriae]